MFGRMLLKLRALSKYDPVKSHFENSVRPRILKSYPVTELTHDAAEIHVLTSNKDWLNLAWTLKSFYFHSPLRIPLVIHGDPSLSQEAIDGLTKLFPEARILTQDKCRDEVIDSLVDYPLCKKFRETNTLSIKVFDFLHYLSTDKMALFDSDLLFFDEPIAWQQHLNAEADRKNVFNPDIATAYAIEQTEIEKAGFQVADDVNSGFGIVHKDSMPLEWIEEFLAIPGLLEGHFWRIEQTLYALCATRFGVELLPENYRVFLDGAVEERPFRHYVGAIRDKMYTEGMRKLAPVLLS